MNIFFYIYYEEGEQLFSCRNCYRFRASNIKEGCNIIYKNFWP